jgi:hypothetical protein
MGCFGCRINWCRLTQVPHSCIRITVWHYVDQILSGCTWDIEKLTVSQLVKKLSACYCFLAIFRKARHRSLTSGVEYTLLWRTMWDLAAAGTRYWHLSRSSKLLVSLRRMEWISANTIKNCIVCSAQYTWRKCRDLLVIRHIAPREQ